MVSEKRKCTNYTKMYKSGKSCKKLSSLVYKVINIKKWKIREKTVLYHHLSTLSTLKCAILVDYSTKTKERVFCVDIIKFEQCRKKKKCILTFE